MFFATRAGLKNGEYHSDSFTLGTNRARAKILYGDINFPYFRSVNLSSNDRNEVTVQTRKAHGPKA